MFLGRGLIARSKGVSTRTEGVSTRSDPFGVTSDLRKHLPKDILPYQGTLVKGIYQKKEIRSRFLKGNRRVRPHPVRCTAAEMPFTYVVAFFPKTSRVFKKIFRFFKIFSERPAASAAHPVQTQLSFKCLHYISTFFSWKINAFPENFSFFLKIFGRALLNPCGALSASKKDARFSCKFLSLQSVIQETAFIVHFKKPIPCL